MKWGTIGILGEQGMKDVILEMTKKLEGKKEEKQLNPTITKALENKVKEHNEDVKDLDVDWNPRVTLSTLEEVMERGIGAFKTQPPKNRPVNNAEQWGYSRVNSFLFALKKGRFQGGKHDTDLLPNNHPVKEEMEEKKLVNMKTDKRELVGTMITDGIEMPLFSTIQEAEDLAKEMGGEGHPEHTMDGETYYMPFESHEEIKAAL